MSNDRPQVAIIGGGIGGLFAANALIAQGLDVPVYEQAPELGAIGAGWSSTLVRFFAPIALVFIAWKDIKCRWDGFNVHARELRRLFMLGTPFGVHMVLEVGAFTGIGVMMGWIGSLLSHPLQCKPR